MILSTNIVSLDLLLLLQLDRKQASRFSILFIKHDVATFFKEIRENNRLGENVRRRDKLWTATADSPHCTEMHFGKFWIRSCNIYKEVHKPGFSIPRSRWMRYNVKGSTLCRPMDRISHSNGELQSSFIGFEFPTRASA